jgi:FMN phosphatase YigB (HAD superfamily)
LVRDDLDVTCTVLLWDFGDTLVDERWMLRAPEGVPEWQDAWIATMADLADAWNVGAVSSAEVCEALAERTGMALDAVATHAGRCCRQVTFHEVAWRVARQRRRAQAVVTVNPDLFTDLVVPACDLDRFFDHIVASHQEGTDDKVALCERALARLGFHGDRLEALLIDNRLELVEAWRDAGGSGYWFRGDDRFARDVEELLGGR